MQRIGTGASWRKAPDDDAVDAAPPCSEVQEGDVSLHHLVAGEVQSIALGPLVAEATEKALHCPPVVGKSGGLSVASPWSLSWDVYL